VLGVWIGLVFFYKTPLGVVIVFLFLFLLFLCGGTTIFFFFFMGGGLGFCRLGRFALVRPAIQCRVGGALCLTRRRKFVAWGGIVLA
ncbi:hypothetical protein ACQWKI_22645, partial [Salmonella enterica subsp. enterica serovar Infantis]